MCPRSFPSTPWGASAVPWTCPSLAPALPQHTSLRKDGNWRGASEAAGKERSLQDANEEAPSQGCSGQLRPAAGFHFIAGQE